MKLFGITTIAVGLSLACMAAAIQAQTPRVRRATGNSRYSENPRYVRVSPYSRTSSHSDISGNSRPSRGPAPRQAVTRPYADLTSRTLEDVSPYYERPARPKKVGVMLHDIITIIVKEQSQTISEAEAERKTIGSYTAVIESWVNLVGGLSLKGTPQRDGDPEAGGNFSKKYKAEADLDIRDRVEFRIAATVVDILPNGNLVLEAHRSVIINNERWDTSLTGIIQPEAILTDNTVLSEQIIELMVSRVQTGSVRDGIRRSWLTRIIDKYAPF